MKKLLALVIAGGFLTALTGCPPATSPAPVVVVKTTPAAPKEKPTTDAPKTDTPKTDTPKTDTPKTDTPKTDTPKTDTPKTDTPKTDTPKTDTPKTDTPKKDTPKTDTPKTDTPKTEPKTHKGTVVTAKDGKLTMKGEDDKTHDHTIGKDVKIIGKDGKDIKLEDLKEGAKIEVTTDDKGVTKIEVK